MESQHQKWITLGYLALATLVGYVFFSVSEKLILTYDLETRVRHIDLISKCLSVLIATIFFVRLYRNEKINTFMSEVLDELTQVTWPTQKETASATLIVIVVVVISGMILGFLDYCWSQLLKWIL